MTHTRLAAEMTTQAAQATAETDVLTPGTRVEILRGFWRGRRGTVERPMHIPRWYDVLPDRQRIRRAYERAELRWLTAAELAQEQAMGGGGHV